MTQRPLATIATVFGAILILSMFFPWFAEGVRGQAGFVTISGVSGDYLGKMTGALAVLGTASMAWFAILRTGPGLSKSLLLVGLFAFAASTILMVIDVAREVSTHEVPLRTGAYISGRQIGIYIALVAAAVAFLAALVSLLRPKTEYVE